MNIKTRFKRLIINSITILLIVVSMTACKENKVDSLGASQTFEVKDTLTSVNNVNVKVILLYGQSNATGISQNAYLFGNDPDTYSHAYSGYDNIMINFITENGLNSSNGEFVNVKLGQGGGSSFFGPEVGIADNLYTRFPDEQIFIIKYSWGGSILHNQWLDGKSNRGELYNAAINFTKASLEYLKSKGYIVEIAGLCWMQGESDAVRGEYSSNYYNNTKRLAKFFREDLKKYYNNHLLFIDAGIEEIDFWPDYIKINDAKKKYSNENEYNIYFSSSELNLTTNIEPVDNPDVAHYDSLSMLKLGRKFASYIN